MIERRKKKGLAKGYATKGAIKAGALVHIKGANLIGALQSSVASFWTTYIGRVPLSICGNCFPDGVVVKIVSQKG
jgi:hypothetical protein